MMNHPRPATPPLRNAWSLGRTFHRYRYRIATVQQYKAEQAARGIAIAMAERTLLTALRAAQDDLPPWAADMPRRVVSGASGTVH